ncbi:hypothetical protein [Lacrimispora sp. 210928-DFI.3.58]|uniref:hypothetical protein n=1 Tax=Lacrimispora sp. 210928-DFI.3.58 TaxID=2883214 RepID=UPI0015B4C47C|nr:hypothetical protein [Lacrimispora sp. 210928-DFI.3.58]MCB7318231.1 hypothetical protein [Lacrimispora sp. 210928-DFI.3.58]
MSEATNFLIWQIIIWGIPFVSALLYIHFCKIGYFEDEEQEEKTEKGGGKA